MISDDVKSGQFAKIFASALPLIAFNLVEVLIGVTDLLVVGRLGDIALAAVGITEAIIVTFVVISFSALSILSVFHASETGEKLVTTGFVFALLLGVVGFLSFQLLVPAIEALDYDPRVVADVEVYAGILQWIVWPALLMSVLKNHLTGLNATKVFLALSVAAIGLNYILNVVLIFGWWIFPAMGIAGAAWATFAVHIMMLVGVLAYWVRIVKPTLSFVALRHFQPALLRRMLKVGLPAAGQQSLETLLFVGVLVIVGTLSPYWLAASSVIFSLMDVVFVFSLGIGEASAAAIALAHAKNNGAVIRQIWRAASSFALILSTTAGIVFFFGAEHIIGAFLTKEGNEVSFTAGVQICRLVAFFLVFDALQIVATYVLRGLEYTLVPFLMGIGLYWFASFVIGVLLVYVFNFGPIGIWIGFCCGLFLAALALTAIVLHKITPKHLIASEGKSGSSRAPAGITK